MSELGSKLCPWLRVQLAELERATTNGRLGHGWIFAGPAGTGKLNLAMVFAMRLLRGETGGPLPAEISPAALVEALEARYLPQDHHPDLHAVWPEEGKRSIGIDRVRAVIEDVTLTGYAGTQKAVIIEPAEWMTVQAANALLKSLEEPTGGTHLILVSHCIGRLPATIRSRCQTLGIRRPERRVLNNWLGLDCNAGNANPLVNGEMVGPVQAAQRAGKEEILNYNKLEDIINSIYQKRLDAGTAVESCRGLEPALILEWLSARVRGEIRHRVAATGTNSITEGRGDLTENHWDGLATSRLFDILDGAGRLRDQLGSGLNEQLALEVLVDEFAPR